MQSGEKRTVSLADVDRLTATGASRTQLNQTGGGSVAIYGDFWTNDGQVTALGYPRGTDFQPGQIKFDNPKNFTERTVKLLEAMEPWDFATNPVHEDLRWSMVWDNND